MAAGLFLPRATQAAATGVRVDWRNAVTNGLSVCGLYGSGDHVELASSSTVPDRWLAPDPMGGLVSGTFTAKTIALTAAATYQPNITLLVTGYAYSSPGFGASGEQHLIAVGNSSGVSIGRGITFWNSSVRGAGATVSFTRGPFVAVMRHAVPQAQFGATSFFFNGAFVATDTGAFGDKSHSHWAVAWGDSTPGTVAWAMSCAWTRALSDDEIMGVMAEPYAMLTR